MGCRGKAPHRFLTDKSKFEIFHQILFFKQRDLTGGEEEGIGLGIAALVIKLADGVGQRRGSTEAVTEVASLNIGIVLDAQGHAGNLAGRIVANREISAALAVVIA